MALTRRQREIYDYICAFVDERGFSPSLEEIGAHFGLRSVATVHKHVHHLVEKGMLRKAWNRSRSVEPVTEDEPVASLVELPILGSVAAGSPIEAVEQGESMAVPEQMRPPQADCFILRVRGDSMIDDQIADGDLVVIERCTQARNGQTVVAMLDGAETTLKRYYRQGSKIKLVPANDRMQPIEVPAADVEVQGVVRGLMRQY